jgi:uncharacterized protein YjiS (DUF1127 family)
MSTDYWNWETISQKRPALLYEMAHAVRRAVKANSDHMAKRRRIRADRKLLMSMPDHMLKDIGIYRSEIDYVLEYGREIDKARTIGRLPG